MAVQRLDSMPRHPNGPADINLFGTFVNPMSRRPIAVIFDVDGVLVRSMERNWEAYRTVFQPLGIEISEDEVFANEGRRSRDLIEGLAKARGLDLSDAELDAMSRRHQGAFASFGRMPLYPGVKPMLRTLRRRGLRLAMVTSNWRVNVANQFGRLERLFDVIVTAEDVTRTKPDPEPYLQALSKLGIAANQAVVVENAPLGIQAAKAAGLRVIAVASTNPPEKLGAADAILPAVSQVVDAIQAIG
jgi:beta-phosphoglucomutase